MISTSILLNKKIILQIEIIKNKCVSWNFSSYLIKTHHSLTSDTVNVWAIIVFFLFLVGSIILYRIYNFITCLVKV